MPAADLRPGDFALVRPGETIPVDGTATAATYKKVSQAGIKLVFMDNVPTGLKHPEQYAAMVSADSEGNGQIAAKVLGLPVVPWRVVVRVAGRLA